jgi:2-phospho-L-lactate/phosphoenolpyruvate guanylyltransferase
VRVVTPDPDAAKLTQDAGATLVDDPGRGQGAAVERALDGVEPGGIAIVNADVPCVLPADIRGLLTATPAGGIALVEAVDGTTNALSIPAARIFSPLYGRDSAARFRARAETLGLQVVSAAVPNLIDDVDTVDDLHRLHLRLGPRSQVCLAGLPAGALS